MSPLAGAVLKATSRVTDHPDGSTRCERQDLNLHGLPHWILSPARLPIPPLSLRLHSRCFRVASLDFQTLYSIISRGSRCRDTDQVDYLLMRTRQGLLTLPPETDIVLFLQHDGKSAESSSPATNEAPSVESSPFHITTSAVDNVPRTYAMPMKSLSVNNGDTRLGRFFEVVPAA